LALTEWSKGINLKIGINNSDQPSFNSNRIHFNPYSIFIHIFLWLVFSLPVIVSKTFASTGCESSGFIWRPSRLILYLLEIKTHTFLAFVLLLMRSELAVF